jgi:phosphatidylethanolamine-binding protein (PEBP) family uncharacterized protein
MVTIRRSLLRAACAAACFMLLSGCGFLSPGTGSTPTLMTVSSEAFVGSVLPVSFTCHTRHPVSPPVGWSGAPADTKSYALVVDDASAPIPPGARQAMNSAGKVGYDAPCPQDGPHTYRFTVYALNSMLNLPAGAPLSAAWQAIAAASIDHGRAPPVTANP